MEEEADEDEVEDGWFLKSSGFVEISIDVGSFWM